MSKRESPFLPNGMVDLIGMGYLAGRPSFAKVAARLKRKGWEPVLTRDQYRLLMLDVKDLDTLLQLTKVDRTKFDVQSFLVNRWGQDSWQVKAQLKPKPQLEDLPIKPAEPKVFKVKSRFPGKTGVDKFYIPDIHFGYRNTPSGAVTLHCEKTVSVYLAVAAAYQPRTIILLGDLLDLPTLGKFLNDPSYNNMVQYAVDAASAFLAALRSACPNARIVMIEGNHEARLKTHLRKFAPELVHVTRPGDKYPAISIENLLRIDDLGVEYIGEYGTHTWIDGIRSIHGEKYGSNGGATVSKMLDEYPLENSVCGHVHRAELAYATKMHQGIQVTYWAMSCGTGAKTDGAVPGPNYPDWQKAFGFVWEGGHPSVHVILDGSVNVAGRIFKLEDEKAAA